MSDWEQGHAKNKGKATRAFARPEQQAERKADRATNILMGKARADREAQREVSAHERKRTVPKPQLTPTGTVRRDGDAVGRAALKSSAQEKQEQAEKMKVVLREQQQTKELGRSR
ncbi:MAG: hypothetical protein RKE49_00795 [Oceanicaulis sp.]